MLAAEPAAGAADLPAADLATEYTSTPFSEFLVEDAGETGDDGAPPGPGAAVAGAAAPLGSADAPASAADGRPRSRTLTAALGAAVLTAAGVAGGLTLLHQRPGQPAQAGPSLGRAPTAPASVPPTAPASVPPAAPAAIAPTAPAAPASPASAAPTASAAVTTPAPAAPASPASALPTPSPTLTFAVVPAQRITPASIEQWAAWIGRRDHYQGRPAAERYLPRDWPPQQFVERWPGRSGWQGDRWGVPPYRDGPDGGLRPWQRGGFRQR